MDFTLTVIMFANRWILVAKHLISNKLYAHNVTVDINLLMGCAGDKIPLLLHFPIVLKNFKEFVSSVCQELTMILITIVLWLVISAKLSTILVDIVLHVMEDMDLTKLLDNVFHHQLPHVGRQILKPIFVLNVLKAIILTLSQFVNPLIKTARHSTTKTEFVMLATKDIVLIRTKIAFLLQ